MAKVNKTICLDSDLADMVVTDNLVLSKFVNSKLRDYFNSKRLGINAVNLLIKEKELQKAKEQQAELDSKVNSLSIAIDKYREKIRQKELEELERKKIIEENSKSCVVCDKKIKTHIVLKGRTMLACTDCLSTATDDKKDWIVEKTKDLLEA
jgi:hypothetical protein